MVRVNIRPSLYTVLQEALTRGRFIPSDFDLSTGTSNATGTQLKIVYQYGKGHFHATLPSRKTAGGDGHGEHHAISFSCRPGRINVEEHDTEKGEYGLVRAIGEWLDRLGEDLDHTPQARAMAELQKQVDDAIKRIGLDKNDEGPLEDDDRESLVEWIHDIEQKMKASFEAHEADKAKLEAKIANLAIQVDALVTIVGSSITKRGAVRAVIGRVFQWAKDPENAKLLKNAGEVVTKMLTDGK